MDIEALAHEKSQILEEFLRLTALMDSHLKTNQVDAFERDLEKRAQMIHELRKVDESLQGQATPYDGLWMRQLKMIETSNQEIVRFLSAHRNRLIEEQKHHTRMKAELFQGAQVDPKGNRIAVSG